MYINIQVRCLYMYFLLRESAYTRERERDREKREREKEEKRINLLGIVILTTFLNGGHCPGTQPVVGS